MSANDRQEGGEHYKRLQPEPWDVVHAWNLDFFLGNAQKYIARAANKDLNGAILDLKKAVHYLEKKIELLKKSEKDYREGRELRTAPLDDWMLPEWYSSVEGSGWHQWQCGPFDRTQLMKRSAKEVPIITKHAELVRVHALKFNDGRIWDCVNGWRKV